MRKKIRASFVFLAILAGIFFARNRVNSPRVEPQSYRALGSDWTYIKDANGPFTFSVTVVDGAGNADTVSGTYAYSSIGAANRYVRFHPVNHPTVTQDFYAVEAEDLVLFMQNPYFPLEKFLSFIPSVGVSYNQQQQPLSYACNSAPPTEISDVVNMNYVRINYLGNNFVDENNTPAQAADVVGTATVEKTNSELAITKQFSATGLEILGGSPLVYPSNACTPGAVVGTKISPTSIDWSNSDFRGLLGYRFERFSIPGQTYYYPTLRSASIKIESPNQGDRFIFALPAKATSVKALAGSYVGFYNNSNFASDVKPVRVVMDAAGAGTINAITDIPGGVISPVVQSTISLTQPNTPTPGMIKGTITRQGVQKSMICMANPMVVPGNAVGTTSARQLLFCVAASTHTNAKNKKMITLVLLRDDVNVAANLPQITSFAGAGGTDQFVFDTTSADYAQLVDRSSPFLGRLAPPTDIINNCDPTHDGAHLHFRNPTAGNVSLPLYAPANGYVSRITECAPAGPNDKYQINLALAKTAADQIVTMSLSLEPMQGMFCSGGKLGDDNGFFWPHILVSEGEPVVKGQLLGHFFLSQAAVPDSDAHLHFDLLANTGFASPGLFNAAIADHFDDKNFCNMNGSVTPPQDRGFGVNLLPAQNLVGP